jgi:hypothetical protein
MRHMRIPVLAAVVLLALAQATPAQEADAQRTAIQRGVEYLLSSQLRDGSWGNELGESREPGMRVAITAMCMNALLRWSPGDERTVTATARGLEFVRKNVSALDGPFVLNPQFNFNSWGTSFGMSHLHEAIKRWPGTPPEVEKIGQALIRRAWDSQMPCGGWSYIKKNRQGQLWTDGSVTFVSAAHIDGLQRWKRGGARVDQKLLDRALTDLEKSIDAAGKLVYLHNGDHGTRGGKDGAGRMIQTRLVLLEAGRSSEKELSEAVDAFFADRAEYVKVRKERGHSRTTGIAGYYYYYVHHYAARALRRLGCDPKGYADIITKAFLSEQQENGSWMDTVSCGTTCGTAFVLIAFDDLRNLTWRDSLDAGLAAAKKDGKPILLFLTDCQSDAGLVEVALGAAEVRGLLKRFVCVRHRLVTKDPLGKRLGVRSGTALVVLDASAGKPLVRPLMKLRGKQKAKGIARELARALKKWEKTR